MRNCVQPHALKVPSIQKLKGKRVVLASSSPRRKDIFQTFGLSPEIVPSTFEENLSQSEFEDIHEYPVATATYKAVEVYERLVKSDPDDPPDLVIGADTVVLTHQAPSISSTAHPQDPDFRQELYEKPKSKEDNLRMLFDLNGGMCEVVTGVAIVFPIIHAPGYKIYPLDDRTLVYFLNNPDHVLKAYAENGEGIDRAGGFALQGLGGTLVRKIDGDFNNVVGFPAASFFKCLETLIEEEVDFLSI